LKGRAVSPGIAIGRLLCLKRRREYNGPVFVDSSLTEQELGKFRQGLARARQELLEITRTAAQQLDPSHQQIFQAQIMLLDDPEMRKEVETEISENSKSAAAAYREVLDRSQKNLVLSQNQYLKERIADIQAAKNRVLDHLSGQRLEPVWQLSTPVVILADFLTPGELIQLDRKHILGLALKEAGTTSHVALLSKAFGVPAVVGWEDNLPAAENNVQAIIDGNSGQVIVWPDHQTLVFYQRRKRLWETQLTRIQKLSQRPSLTKDKVKISVLANIDIPEETELARQYGAEGVGLYRTEFMFLVSPGFPSEEEQYQAYRRALERFYPRPVTIRTTDLGGDKLLGSAEEFKDPNPFLGWRAIRVCLDSVGLFKAQLRALYRASVKGNLKIMIPMICAQEEVNQLLKIAGQVRRELKKEKIPFNPRVPLGIMVETPSAALNSSGLARQVDFLSLGTNDLTQYTLAVDRGNKRVAHLFDELDPAVLKLINLTVRTAQKTKTEISICGEMAASTLALPVLLGLGLRQLSVAPVHIPKIKQAIGRVNLNRARKLAAKLVNLHDRSEVRKALRLFTQSTHV
jgi:phosphotransferase system enzyme I (PtsI)